MFTKVSFSDRVRQTGLDTARLIVIGSGTMDSLGIRRAQDVDIAVPAEYYEMLRTDTEWQERVQEASGQRYLVKGECEIWDRWSVGDVVNSYIELLPHTIVRDGVRYCSLAFVKEWKKLRGRGKDIQDIALIEAYESDHG